MMLNYLMFPERAQVLTLLEANMTYDVTKDVIIDWLGNKPCLLLIDELNVCTKNTTDDAKEKIYSFLKTCFLIENNRYFVFSSHVISTSTEAGIYLEPSASNREIILRWLPRIPDITTAAHCLPGQSHLTALRAVYNGLIPALLIQRVDYHFSKLSAAVDSICVGGKLTGKNMIALMRHFVTGDKTLVLPEMLGFMDASRDDIIIWIPRFMEQFLRAFAIIPVDDIAPWRRNIVTEIWSTFESFKSNDIDVSKAWEILFKTVILIRLLGGLFDKIFLPLDKALFSGCSVSYNAIHRGSFQYWTACTDLTRLIELAARPSEFPHVAVYHPPNLRFRDYDLFVFAYETDVNPPLIFGYQLKLGKKVIAKTELKRISEDNCRRFWIRGDASSDVSTDVREVWHVATDAEIDSFFGESGVNWTPKAWNKLIGKIIRLYYCRNRIVEITSNVVFLRLFDYLYLFNYVITI
jgi:hypothetical protein